MPKSGVEAYIYLDFYSDEIYTEDEIKIDHWGRL